MKEIERLVKEMIVNGWLIVDGDRMLFTNEWYERETDGIIRHDNICFDKNSLVKMFFGVLEDMGLDVEEAVIKFEIDGREYLITYLSMLDDYEIEDLNERELITVIEFL
jgi:hypothetical protein